MTNINNNDKSEWYPLSDMRIIDEDISQYGYSREYVIQNGLQDQFPAYFYDTDSKYFYRSEPIEIKIDGDQIYYRENENHPHMIVPPVFETQFGEFVNHNNGEFFSWLGKEDYCGLTAKEKEMHLAFGRKGFFIEGNYCDMFDCGAYTYAISNLMHMGLGRFAVMRINKDFDVVCLYSNSNEDGWKGLNSFEYCGRISTGQSFILVFSGIIDLEKDQKNSRSYQEKTFLLRIDPEGNCTKQCEWDIELASPNSIASKGNEVFFGQNRMVTRLNILTGATSFYTNKNDVELSALSEEW